MKYDFRFLTEEESLQRDEHQYWFDVGKIIEFQSLRDINGFMRDNGMMESKFAEDSLFNLFELVTTKKIINYYLETSQELDKVLNIFIRVNSGGTILSYSDLLLSIATAQWKSRDAREAITGFVDDLNQIGSGFQFDKDFVLKSCLILSDIKDIAFKVDNFNTENMKTIELKWPEITRALRLSVELITGFGYDSQTLVSSNVLIPIAYYLQKLGAPANFPLSSSYQEDRIKIKKWLMLSLLKRAFSGQPDNVLRPIRKILKGEVNGFPLDEIIENFKGTSKSITFNDDDIEFLLGSKYGQNHTFSVLALLYPTLDFRNKFHLDHIFPKSFFTPAILKKKSIKEEDTAFYLENVNNLANIQLLEGIPNEEKSNKEFEDWFQLNYPDDTTRKNYKDKNYIPEGISMDFANFKEFFGKRNEMLRVQLRKTLV